MLEQAGKAASVGARTEQALLLLERAQTIREQLGDPAALVRVIGIRARALADGRQFDASMALVEPAVERFADLGDDPAMVDLRATLARNLVRMAAYDRGLAEADRVMATAERLQLSSVAAETMIVKGQAFGFQGRMWEARALYDGARHLADEVGLPETALAASQSLSFEIALDDSRAAVAAQREALELARRLGRRTIEITILGNVCEDARRTGDWDWALQELDDVLSLHADGVDAVPLRLARQVLLAHRGQSDPAEIDDIDAFLGTFDDPDVAVGVIDMRSSVAYSEGRWAQAAAGWLKGVRQSDLNAPYLLPRAANALILAGDAAGAGAALQELDRLGTRGRAVDADRAAIRGGIAALGGDRDRAMAELRAAVAAWRNLRLPWDEALTTLIAARWIGVAEPEVAAWAEAARTTFESLRAAPMLDRLAEAVAAGPGTTPAGLEPRRSTSSSGSSVSIPTP